MTENLKDKVHSSFICFGANPYSYGIEDVIPEVARLAETTPYRYRDVLWLCQEYGEGYKELIQKHINAGTTYKALEEMEAELWLRKVTNLLEREEIQTEIDKQPLININELELRKMSKEDKLPKKYRRGWK